SATPPRVPAAQRPPGSLAAHKPPQRAPVRALGSSLRRPIPPERVSATPPRVPAAQRPPGSLAAHKPPQRAPVRATAGIAGRGRRRRCLETAASHLFPQDRVASGSFFPRERVARASGLVFFPTTHRR